MLRLSEATRKLSVTCVSLPLKLFAALALLVPLGLGLPGETFLLAPDAA